MTTKPVYIDPNVTESSAEPAVCPSCGQQFTEHRPGDPEHCVRCHDERTTRAAEAFMRAFGKAFKGGLPSSCGTGECPSCRKRTR